GSLNVPAVRVAQRVGMPRLLETLRRVGLRTIDPDPGEHGLALALGAAPVRLLDLAGAYAMLARGGTYLEPRFIAGPPGAEPPPRILSSESAYLISSILSDARARGAAFGPETPLELPFEAAAKTGTSQAYCDNLVVGYTPQITVAVWVGNFDGQPMRGLLSMQGAAPLWRDAMLAAMRGRPRLRFERPPGVEPALTCPLSGLARGAHCPSGRLEPIDRTRGPLPSCSWHGPEGLRLPLSLFAGVSGAPEVLAASGEHAPLEAADSLRILSPLEGDVIVLDPLLNPASQALPLVALVGATGLSAFWELDGERLAATPTPLAMAEIGAGDGGAGIEALRALWAPVPGRHQLRAVVETAQGAISSRVEFSVEPIGGGA
ncbi:MAG: penicillin-binding transpeptidase domain-containing protein, partial [Myxococcales bacterium]|nr:penicillin-binding transpeptidase domain-containing protein [Myxococcales bacterium]